jgi:hypothetical protein
LDPVQYNGRNSGDHEGGRTSEQEGFHGQGSAGFRIRQIYTKGAAEDNHILWCAARVPGDGGTVSPDMKARL